MDYYTPLNLQPGDVIEGLITKMPQAGAVNGNSLYLHTKRGEKFSVHATAKSGHTVLEKRLAEMGASVGTCVRIEYTGKRPTKDGEREYRHYVVDETAE